MNELEKHISIVITLCAITLYYIGFFYLDAFLNTRIQLRSAIPVIMRPHAICH